MVTKTKVRTVCRARQGDGAGFDADMAFKVSEASEFYVEHGRAVSGAGSASDTAAAELRRRAEPVDRLGGLAQRALGLERPYRVAMRASLYRVEHATNEQLVVASSVSDGRTACADHAKSVNLQLVPTASGRRVNMCKWCLRVPHRANCIVDQLPLCIRHAADALFPEDDMGAHDMTHAAYLRLQVDGVSDAY